MAGCCSLVWGQEAIVRGVVVEENKEGNFLPIVGATVRWLNTQQGTVTDTNGVFSIPTNPLSKFLIVSFIGYVSDTIAVFNPNALRIILKTDDGRLQEVQISAERTSLFQEYLNPILTQHITEKELFKAACCNLSESFETNPFIRTEVVGGVFGEYTFSYLDKFNLVAGLQGDAHNLFGFFATPRLHIRYAIMPNTVLRFSAGRGQRTANIFIENIPVLATSRNIEIMSYHLRKPYGLQPEVAWNYGVSLSQDFTLGKRDGNITVEYFRTDFINQVVVDYDYSPQKMLFYNLIGASYSNSFQTEVNYELQPKLNLRLAYRYLDVRTAYLNGWLTKPFVASHRGFANVGYQTRNRWHFDYTVSWVSAKRIPNTASNPAEFRVRTYSPPFFIHHAQISKLLNKKADVYVGGENLFDFRQQNPIISAEQPYSPYFDASLVWAPIIGRMIMQVCGIGGK